MGIYDTDVIQVRDGPMVAYRLLQARVSDDPVRSEERAAFAAQLGVQTEDVQTWDVLQGTSSFEAVTDGVDAVLVGGSGEFSVLSNESWLPSFFDTLGALAENGFPTFASCFGFQGMVVALGGEVVTDESAAEVGTFELTTNENAEGDIMFGELPRSFVGQEGHKDRARRLPDCLTNFVSSKRCPNQAIRYKDSMVFATQFHPELTGNLNRLRFKRYYDMYEQAFGAAGARSLLDTFMESPEANALLTRFHRLVSSL